MNAGARRVEGGGDREIREREAPKIDAFPMQNSRSTTLLVAGQHATGNPLLTSLSIYLSPSFPLARARYGMPRPCPSFSTARTYVSASIPHHTISGLRHLRPEQNRERYRSN